ncbi:MAG: DUF3445 domain-containing protein [Verrucomicrobiota bacterium]
MVLAELIPDGDHQFQMRFQRGRFADFFGPSEQRGLLLQQRRHWLRGAPDKYAALLPEGQALLEAAIALARSAGDAPNTLSEGNAWHRCLALGEWWEPDFLLLGPDAAGEIRLWAACVCFPSSWNLDEKMGRPIEQIHGVVPGLNQTIGHQIHQFLARLKPGISWERTNWGLSRSPELNQHPHRQLPRLDAAAELSDVWLRVEHQSLVALGEGNGILFGIRLRIHPLRDVAADPLARPRLIRALATMPEPMAAYKGLGTARGRILQLLEA